MVDEIKIEKEIKEPFEEDTFEEEVEIVSPKETPDEEKEYLLKALEEGDKDVGIYYKYKALGIKQKEGKPLTDEEKAFMIEMNELYEIDRQMKEKQEQEIKNEEEQKEKVMEEYKLLKSTNPEKIDFVDTKTKRFSGGDSIPKLLTFALAMKKTKEKGGKVLVKVTRDRKFYIEWTNKDVHFVEFYTKDDKGNVIPEVTRFTEYKYSYEGSPVPVLFAIQGYYEGYDFYDKYKKDITAEMVSRIASRARHAGYLEGINLKDKDNKKNGMLGALTEWMPIILVIGLLIMGWLMYQMYGSMAEMYQTVQVMQSQMNTLVPVIDANALVLR